MTFHSAPIAVGTADTLIFECPATLEGSVHGLLFENYSGADADVTIKLYKHATGATNTVRIKTIAAGEEYEFTKINVSAGDRVLAAAETAGVIRALANAYVDTATPAAVGFTPRGTWLVGSAYNVNDVVELNGTSYVARAANTGSQPPSASWMILAQRGEQGPAGSGSGDMQTATYDPTGVGGDAFDMDNMAEGDTNKILTASERTKLASISAGATANATDAQLRDRSTHTGTQPASTITGLGTAALLNTGTTAGNIPVLDGNGLLNTAILPAIAVTDVFEVGSQAAMLALTAQRGDMAIRTDLNKTFALAAEPASTLANWKELRTPTDVVLAVAGLTGTITAAALKTALAIAAADITDASANGRALITAANYAAMKTLLAITAADITNSTATGRALLTVADVAGVFTLLGLGNAATLTKATTGQYRGNVADCVLTPDIVWGDAAPVAATVSGTVDFDFATFLNRTLTASGNLTFGTISNAQPLTSFTVEVIHSGAARTISLNSTYWVTPDGAGLSLSTTAGARDLLGGVILSTGKALVSVIAKGVS